MLHFKFILNSVYEYFWHWQIFKLFRMVFHQPLFNGSLSVEAVHVTRLVLPLTAHAANCLFLCVGGVFVTAEHGVHEDAVVRTREVDAGGTLL